MNITETAITAAQVEIDHVIYNPNFPRLNRCLEVNEIDDSRPGRRTFTDTYLGESVTVRVGQTLTRVVETF
jgi:hypothetical protein